MHPSTREKCQKFGVLMSVGVMTVGVMSVEVMTVGVMSVEVMTVGVMRRPQLNKLTIFHSFILSNFNFCPLAWHFCSKANTMKLEKIQERALRFIYEDYNSTYEELLHICKSSS